jgi:hypothetical protein
MEVRHIPIGRKQFPVGFVSPNVIKFVMTLRRLKI